MDGLAQLLLCHGCRRVLEVAAGSGALAAPMRARGLEWRATDACPCAVEDMPSPERCEVLAALEKYGHEVDAVFWSWYASLVKMLAWHDPFSLHLFFTLLPPSQDPNVSASRPPDLVIT